ncbi:MAG: arsenic resistance protein [Bacillota bacterium]|nr:arsenic resistance protein [Bacillota bacterium]
MKLFLKLFHWPGKNLTLAIPAILIIGFVVGNSVNTGFLKSIILPATFVMIYPTMIGFQLRQAVNTSYLKVVMVAMAVNFVLIPAIAYLLGSLLLSPEPLAMAGLILASLLPTSGMTISWTMLYKGNVPAAIKMTALGLILGSFLAPWYLQFLIGKTVPVQVGQIFLTIALVVLIPLLLGNVTYRLILEHYSPKQFQEKIKPLLPSLSIWAMLVVIFSSISMRAPLIISNPSAIWQSLGVLILFYIINFSVSTLIARQFFAAEDAIALVYGTVMRNLSLALGLAINTFGVEAALIVTLAFIIQVQGAAWYGKLANRFNLLASKQIKGGLKNA